MPIVQVTTINIFVWRQALAFGGAGLGNAAGGAAIQARFQRWGYPAWWNFVTAALEIFDAALIVFTRTRLLGLSLGSLVMMAATGTVICAGNTNTCDVLDEDSLGHEFSVKLAG